jgi:integrase/recombinase XerC
MKQRVYPPAWPIAEWVVSMSSGKLSEGTIDRREYHVARFAREHPDPWAVAVGDVEARLALCVAPEYAKSVRSSIRAFYVWAIRRGYTASDPTRILPPIEVGRPRSHPCPDEVLQLAMATADEDTRLMLALAGQCGLRRFEVAKVRREDLDGDFLMVLGKGRVERRVPLTRALVLELTLRPPGWLFPGRFGGPITPGTAGRRIARALGHGQSAHALRHRAATTAYGRTHDLILVQQVLGHASVATTQRYIATSDDALREWATVMAAP